MARTPRVLLHAPTPSQQQALAELLASDGCAVEALPSLPALRDAWDRGDVAVVDLTAPGRRRRRPGEETLRDLARAAAAVPLIALTHGGRRAVEGLGAVALPVHFDTHDLLGAVRALTFYLYDDPAPAWPAPSAGPELDVAA